MSTRFSILLFAATAAFARKHETGLTLGRFTSGEISFPSGKLELGSGNGFQAGYGCRLHGSPWVAIGGGYAQYAHSLLRQDGQPNQAPRRMHGGVFTFGGGADPRVLPWLSLRGEIRDFYTGSPTFNVLTSGSKRHNVVLGGALSSGSGTSG